jgi:hypothetical protein
VRRINLNIFFLLLPIILASKYTFNLGLAADDFWRLPLVHSIQIKNIFTETLNWIPGRNLQIIWMKILTIIFGVENSDIWKYHVFGLMLLGFLGVSFYKLLKLIKVDDSASIPATLLFILWPTHSETSFWIEQSIQVQLPLLFIILWIILNISQNKLNLLAFIVFDFILIVCTLFTYDQAGFLIAFLIVSRIIYFTYFYGFTLVALRFIPSLVILILWVELIVGVRSAGPEFLGFNELRIEYFFGNIYGSFETNFRIFSPLFQPYSLYHFWPWDIGIKFSFVTIFIFFYFIFLFHRRQKSKKVLTQNKGLILTAQNLIFIYPFYFITFSGFIVFLLVNIFNGRLLSSHFLFVFLGNLIFFTINLLIDSRLNSSLSHSYRNFVILRLYLVICFYVSYFPIYLWYISPRHHLIPSAIVSMFIAILLHQIFYFINMKNLSKIILRIFLSFYLATLAINFHFSARAFSQSWILKQRLYADLHSVIPLNDYTPELSCWIVKNPPQEFMGYPLFVYESPQLGINHIYKLPNVGSCDTSKDLSSFNVLRLIFRPDISFFEKFEYTFEIIPSQL